MSLGGSAPQSCWPMFRTPIGHQMGPKLVVAHYVGVNRCQLEFPPGKILIRIPMGRMAEPSTVSPRGDQIAFLEHPRRNDSNGFVAIVDLTGKKKTLSKEFNDISGLAWEAAGDAILFSGQEMAATRGARDLFRITIEGHQDTVRRESGNLKVDDVSRDGHLLLTRDTIRNEVFGRIYPETKERELGWLDDSNAVDLSRDGKSVLLSAEGESSSGDPDVYVRKTDGSPGVRLGDGYPDTISPDGKWVLTSYPSGDGPPPHHNCYCCPSASDNLRA